MIYAAHMQLQEHSCPRYEVGTVIYFTMPAIGALQLVPADHYLSAFIALPHPFIHCISPLYPFMSSILELYDTSGRRWELVDDDETVSDAEGLGHAAGKFISWGGRHLDAAIAWLSSRLGIGPSGPMVKMIRLMHRLRCGCPEPGCRRMDSIVVPHAASSEDILQTLLKFSAICDRCLEKHRNFLSDKRMVACAKSLIKMLR
jgi:hypothetical protein